MAIRMDKFGRISIYSLLFAACFGRALMSCLLGRCDEALQIIAVVVELYELCLFFGGFNLIVTAVGRTASLLHN